MNDAKFRLEARKLIRKKIADRSKRMAAVDALIDTYVDENGTKPDGYVVGELADYILCEELTDIRPDKVTRNEHPILSARQARFRSSREKPLSYVSESVSSDNVDVLFYDTTESRLKHEIKHDVENYSKINRKQPITTYNLREIMGDEEFRKAYPIVPQPYAAFRSKDHVEWSLDVRRRDGFTCQKCGKSGKGMHAHHIEAYDTAIDLRHDINNGITLCRSCHQDFHSIYGKGGNTRAQLDEWMGDSYYEL